MEFHKLEAPSLKDLFIQQLEDMILSGQLQVGQKLPSERELASSMQVSRAVVNSGIAEMERKGFLVVKPRVGTFVEDYRKNGTLETLVSIMSYNGGTLQEDDIRSLLEMRIILTSLSCSLAIEHASDEEITHLGRFIDQLKTEKNPDTAASLVFHFYHELAFICGNTLLPLFFISFKELVSKLWSRYCQNYGIQALYDNTETIYRYLKQRDIDAITQFIKISTDDAIGGSHTIYTLK